MGSRVRRILLGKRPPEPDELQVDPAAVRRDIHILREIMDDVKETARQFREENDRYWPNERN